MSTGMFAQDFQGAADAYSAVLATTSAPSADKLAAASNRAACSLVQRNYSSVVDDCTIAFELLTGQDLLAIPDMHAWLASDQGGSQAAVGASIPDCLASLETPLSCPTNKHPSLLWHLWRHNVIDNPCMLAFEAL